MFVVIFVNFKSRALSHDPSGDRIIPRAEVPSTRALATHGNITVLSHLKQINPALQSVPFCSSIARWCRPDQNSIYPEPDYHDYKLLFICLFSAWINKVW